MRILSAWTLGVTGLLLAPIAAAGTITFTGSGTAASNPVSASAEFTITGTSLTITLTNTSGANDNQDVPGSTLTGLFFDLGSSNPELTPVSATVTAGSSIFNPDACSVMTGPHTTTNPCTSSTTNVGGEFGYAFNGAQDNPDEPGDSPPPAGLGGQGIASSGYLDAGTTGNVGNFGGTNLDDPNSLDGINFGLISAASGFNPNGGLSNVPLIQDSVQFMLTLPDETFDIGDISNVSFQYGTSFSEANIPGTPFVSVPEPSALLLLGFGLMVVGGLTYTHRKRHGKGKSLSRRAQGMLELDDYLAQDAPRQ